MEAGAAPDAAAGRHHEQGRALHLAGLHPQALPSLPFVLEFCADRHPPRGVLPIEAVLGLYHPGVDGLAHTLSRCHQCIGDRQIRRCRKFNGRVLPAGTLLTDGGGGHHNIAGAHLEVDPAAGTHPDKCISPDITQFFHGDGGGWAADAGGAYRHRLPQKRAGVNCKFPVLAHQPGIIKQLRNGGAPPRVSRENTVAPHLSLGTADVKLPFPLLHSCHLILKIFP